MGGHRPIGVGPLLSARDELVEQSVEIAVGTEQGLREQSMLEQHGEVL